MVDKRIVVALDYPGQDEALAFVNQISPESCRLKVGKELFTKEGPQFVEKLQSNGFEIFLDLKFHDIPNTVAQAVKVAADLGVWMVNVHALGGRRMMETVCERVSNLNQRPKLIAVTVLTSMEAADLTEIGLNYSPEEMVSRLASLTKSSGFDGVVCSALEAGMIKSMNGSEFLTVTPGIRPADASTDDQSRIMTPELAVKNGSDYLVIGRPITKSVDPVASLEAIRQSIGEI
ncbi:orotidine-5'-phosphate decarboxylase [Leeia sp. TBRC 13508]|uniref:Orotidine 5'-phosphate decarboxylase n=1 Tax=Leeia speluncae TaxID=2884804 RepID=A0ABS8DAM2_9NEIS|nr:orotidine-5'-phosphate decarboxylase [Leeia speluncae]MCB6185264.1 orotidine-5'-phosphate decarboxylase [Leeia speluncae]